ncbi:MAG: VWA domain-containing protein [Fibrobacterales bacterium]
MNKPLYQAIAYQTIFIALLFFMMTGCLFDTEETSPSVGATSSDASSSTEELLSSEALSTPKTVLFLQTEHSDTVPRALPEITSKEYTAIETSNPTSVMDTVDSETGAFITHSAHGLNNDGTIRSTDELYDKSLESEVSYESTDGSGTTSGPADGPPSGGGDGAGTGAGAGGSAGVAVDDAYYDYDSDEIIIEEDLSNTQATARQLTAAEWYDHAHWSEFRTFLYTYPEYYEEWGLNVQKRVIITLKDSVGVNIPDARIVIKKGDNTVFKGRSTANGTVVFFPLVDEQEEITYDVSIFRENDFFTTTFMATDDDDQLWVTTLPVVQEVSTPAVDIVFTIDVTGSMGDELNYLKEELLDITEKIMDEQIAGIRLGLIFYKDRSDDFITKGWDLTDDLQTVQANMETMQAGGGGDFPESVNQALKESMQAMDWKESAAIRLNFLIADAPPNSYDDEQYTYIDATREATEKGVKIITVAASGIDRTTEYLFRSIAVATMGKYIYLTDHSGIGGGHLEAEVSEMKVETLNEILTRTIKEEIALWPGLAPVQ